MNSERMANVKFATQHERYLRERQRFSEKTGKKEVWSIADQWPLYCGIENLARYLSLSDLVRETLSVPGHLAEFGTFRGSCSLLFAKLLRIFSPLSQKVVYTFDHFEGLQDFNALDGPANFEPGKYKGSAEELEEMIRLYRMENAIVLYKGKIEDRLTAILQENLALTFSFVFCDTDLYESTKNILEHVHPRLSVGGIFVFDQWNFENYPGEGVAVNNFLREFGGAYEMRTIPNTAQPSLLLRKLKM